MLSCAEFLGITYAIWIRFVRSTEESRAIAAPTVETIASTNEKAKSLLIATTVQALPQTCWVYLESPSHSRGPWEDWSREVVMLFTSRRAAGRGRSLATFIQLSNAGLASNRSSEK